MMIEVNLLPAEMRRVEHTPLPRFLVIIIGTAAIMATGAFGVVVNLRKVADRTEKATDLQRQVQESERAAGTYDELLDDIADTQNRKKAIAELWRSRIAWSRKLTEIAKIMPAFGGLQQMKLGESRGNRTEENGGLLTLAVRTASDDHSRVAWLRRAFRGEVSVKGSDPWAGRDFFSAFQDILPTRTAKIEEKDYVEKVALEFELNIPLKTSDTRLEEALKAAAETNRKKKQPAVPPSGGTPLPNGGRRADAAKPAASPRESGLVEAVPAADAGETPATSGTSRSASPADGATPETE